MTIDDQLAEAIAIVNGLPDTRRGGAFVAGVERFVAFLGTIPDNKFSDVTESVVVTLRREADRLVDCIENRLELKGDRSSVQQKLASGVYDIRRNMEQIELWLRHYRAGSHPE
jgi:hypothetical protein